MNNCREEVLILFMRLLKDLNLSKGETCAIASCMESEEMIFEIVEKLKVKGPETTHQETMNICGAVIAKYSKKE